MRGFRLLRAAGHFTRSPQRTRSGVAASDALALEVEFAPNTVSPTGSWVSVVIGRNGVGKSRLLAGIAELFRRLESGRAGPISDNLVLTQLEYVLNGYICRLKVTERGDIILISDAEVENKFPLPGKVIALTTTPFDKFRVFSTTRSFSELNTASDSSFYSYLGLRDRTGRASTTAAIFRSLEGLFEASTSSEVRRQKISGVFEFLGYAPRIEVVYRRSITANFLEEVADGVDLEKLIPIARFNSPFFTRIRSSVEEASAFRLATKKVLERMSHGRVAVRADFLTSAKDDQLFKQIQPLRRAGLLRMEAVNVERLVDGTVLDLRLASSGELGIVTGFLGLASVIEDNSLVFIDEPEISLHPEWQINYIDLLTKTFSHFQGCHFVLATHSPMILSDVDPEASNIVSLDPERRTVEDSHEYAGKSYDFLLATAFNEPGNNNMYVKEVVIKALRLAADGQTSTPEFKEILDLLSDNLKKIRSDSPVAQLIREIQAISRIGASS